MSGTAKDSLLVYIGTYTSRGSEGIHVFRFDTATGGLTPAAAPAPVENPSFLALHPSRPRLYGVSEVRSTEGRSGSSVHAFAIDTATGALAALNEASTQGPGPCHVAVDPTGRFAAAANYAGGSVVLFPLDADGRLREASDFVQHTAGSGANPKRQDAPHAHSVTWTPDGSRLLVADLGMDRVVMYRLDAERAKLEPDPAHDARSEPGAGPRHLAFHTNGRYVYVVNELDASVAAYDYDADAGALERIQSVPGLPADFTGTNLAADIHLTPDGRFLYSSNRGHDSLAIFEVDPETGGLSLVEHAPCGGKEPRNFAIDPTGTFLLCAHQNSNTIVTFRIEPDSGRLSPTGHVAEVSMPVCVRILTEISS